MKLSDVLDFSYKPTQKSVLLIKFSKIIDNKVVRGRLVSIINQIAALLGERNKVAMIIYRHLPL